MIFRATQPHHQCTIHKTIHLSGVALHTGVPTHLRICPAPANSGIRFIRVDLDPNIILPAHSSHVMDTRLATTLGDSKVRISTVEHLLSAVFASGIDNLTIEVDGAEIPILDGSSIGFYQALQDAKVKILSGTERKYLRILKTVSVQSNESWAKLDPSDSFTIHASIEWDHPAIGYQERQFTVGKDDFSEIATSRTFGFIHDVEKLRNMGLARGGSFENVIVLDETRVLNEAGLRFPDEFIRHKILDAIGDFSLVGMGIIGSFRLHRSGHDIHAKLIQKLLSDSSNYEIITLKETQSSGQLSPLSTINQATRALRQKQVAR